jgi:hypothetical protein
LFLEAEEVGEAGLRGESRAINGRTMIVFWQGSAGDLLAVMGYMFFGLAARKKANSGWS